MILKLIQTEKLIKQIYKKKKKDLLKKPKLKKNLQKKQRMPLISHIILENLIVLPGRDKENILKII